MTENKRFKMKKLEYESYFIDSQQEYVDEDEPNFKIDGEKTMSDSQILDLLNENEQLRKEIERKEKIIRDKSELVRQQVNVSENLQARINILERALEEEE